MCGETDGPRARRRAEEEEKANVGPNTHSPVKASGVVGAPPRARATTPRLRTVVCVCISRDCEQRLGAGARRVRAGLG